MAEKLTPNRMYAGRHSRIDLRLVSQIRFLFFGLVYLDTLAAYNVSFIPIPWFSYFLAGLILIFIAANRSFFIKIPGGITPVILYVLVAIIVSIISLIYSPTIEMPSQATLPYPAFLFTRFFVLFGYLVVVITAYNVSSLYGTRFIIKILMVSLVIVSLSSFYIYIAQLYGLWEPPRNRMGTGGQDFLTAKVVFSYGFFRALGTFREPSHLAIWMVGVFFLTFSGNSNPRNILVQPLAITVIVLSGSLLALIGLTAGGLVMFVAGRLRVSFRSLLGFFFVVMSGLIAIRFFSIDFVKVLFPRIEALLFYGVGETNRSFVWNYFFDIQPPFFGNGIGNSNIEFGRYLGNSLMPSFLNIFLNAWYSLGIIGVALVSIYLVSPFISIRTWLLARRDATLAACLASLAAWFVFYSGNDGEFALMHAVIVGVFFGRLRELRKAI